MATLLLMVRPARCCACPACARPSTRWWPPTAWTWTCAGEIHAIIGPNGAGKSTLIAQICGEIRPDSGSIHLDGRDVTALRAFERARLGLGRSFQITELCQEYTALENVILSCMLKTGRAFQLWSDPRRDAGLKEQALGWLEHVGLRDRRHVRTADLAHGGASWSWPWRWPARRDCCCWTSPWPAWGRRNRPA